MKSLRYVLPCLCLLLAVGVGCAKKSTSDSGRGTATVDTVVISGMAFHPAELTVNPGDTVLWVNEDLVTHDVTEYPDSDWASGDIKSGGSWKKVVDKNLHYFCSIHPTMKGEIKIRQ